MPTTMTKTTEDNLREAFIEESKANRKYLAFATQAEKDGFKNVASLLRATADSENIHTLGYLAAMDGIKSTRENLESILQVEIAEQEEMLPSMFEQADNENHKAKRLLRWAMEVERAHAKLFKKALAAVVSGKDLESEVWLCPICGHLEYKNAPDHCPVCNSPGSRFERFSGC